MNETMTGIANQMLFWSIVFLFSVSVYQLLKFAQIPEYKRQWYDYVYAGIGATGAVFFVIAVAKIIGMPK